MIFKLVKNELIINENRAIDTLRDAFKDFQIDYECMEVLGVSIGDKDYRVQFGLEKVVVHTAYKKQLH